MTAENPQNQDATRLATQLREAREFANLSQQFVSEQTGIPRSAISDIERGTRKVDSLELKRLAELYRMPISYFLGDDVDDEIASASGDRNDPLLTALARATSKLTDGEKTEVLRFALFLERFERKNSSAQ
jgi:transcriptional regulator with XRE-family HTH domain